MTIHPGESKGLLSSAFELPTAVLNLLLNVLALGNFVKVLDTDDTSWHLAVLTVIGPGACVNTPTSTIPACLLHLAVQVEAADDDNPTTGTTQSWNLGLSPPSTSSFIDVAVLQIFSELFVVALSSTFALDTHDDSLTAVLVEELVNILEHVFEVLGASQGNGKHAVDKSKFIIVRTHGHSNVEEPNTIFELLHDVNCLTSNRRKRSIACRRIVRARNRKQGEWPFVVKLVHPAMQLGRREDGKEGTVGGINDSEIMFTSVQVLRDR